MIALKIAAGLLLFYVVFLAAPAVVAYFAAFSRKRGTPLEEMRPEKTYYGPYLPRLTAAGAFLEAIPHRPVEIRARDGVRLLADWYDGGFPRTAVCVHGYRATPMNNFRVQGKKLWELGFNLLLVHQRAHGVSGGSWTGLGLIEQYDLLDWEKWAEEDGAKQVLLFGMSMGSAAVGYAADKLEGTRVKGMILDCGFSSPYDQLMWDCKKRRLPGKLMLPVMALCARVHQGIDIRTPVADALKKTHVPALFYHGTADSVVPPEQGRANFAACGGPREFIEVEGADHTVSYLKGGKRAEQALEDFIRRSFTE